MPNFTGKEVTMITFFSWLFGVEEIVINVILTLFALLAVGGIAWLIKEHFRIKRSLTGMCIFPAVNAPIVPHSDTTDYPMRFIEQIAPKITYRNGIFSPNPERSTHILSIELYAKRGVIDGRHAFIIDASVTLKDRASETILAHGNLSVDDRQEVRHSPPVRDREGRLVSTGHRYVADTEQWGTSAEGRVRGLNMLADKILQFIDSNRAVRLLVEKAKETEAALKKTEADLARRGNQPS